MTVLLTLVPDGILRRVDLGSLVLFNPGQGRGSSPLGPFAGSIAVVLDVGAALDALSFGPSVIGAQEQSVTLPPLKGTATPHHYCQEA